jgi:hypothetical protein
MRRLILFLAVLPLCAVPSLPTTIVAAVAPNRIVLGADSLLTVEGETNGKREKACKIISENGIAFASTGMFFLQKERRTSSGAVQVTKLADTAEIARRAIHRATDVIDAADKFALFYRQPMLDALEAERRYNPQGHMLLHINELLITTVFAGFLRNGIPMVVSQNFSFEPPRLVETRSYLTANGGNNFKVYGEQSAVARFQQSNTHWFVTTPDTLAASPIGLVTKLLNIQIANDSEFVDGPLSTIEVREHEHRWIDAGLCGN